MTLPLPQPASRIRRLSARYFASPSPSPNPFRVRIQREISAFSSTVCSNARLGLRPHLSLKVLAVPAPGSLIGA